MKLRLLIICLLTAAASFAQPSASTYQQINQSTNWLQMYLRRVHLPAGDDTTRHTLQWPGAGRFILDTTSAGSPKGAYIQLDNAMQRLAFASEIGGSGQNFGEADTVFSSSRHVNGRGLYNFLFDSIPDFQINDAAGNNRFQIANVRTKLFSASGNSSIEMGDTMSFTAPQFHITDLPAATTNNDKTAMVYDTSTTHWQRMEFTPLDTTGRYAAGDSSLLYYDTTTKTLKHIAFADVGGSGGGTPAGNTTNIQLNRNGAFAAAGSDSLTWIANGLNIKGRYMVDGAAVVYQPDQSGTEFLNSIFFGSLPASLNNGSGIQAQYLTGVGKLALNANTTGASNVAVGSRSLQANTTGSNIVAVGDGALIANTSGGNSVAIGMAAAPVSSTASFITAVGFESLRMNTASTNTAYAYRSLHENTSGGSNVGLGPDAGYQNQTGSFNTWVGASSGTGAGSSSNSNNTGVGYQSGFANSTGSNNIFLGYRAGDALTTGSNNITIGYDVDAASNTGSNQLNFGNIIKGTGLTGTGTTSAGRIGIGGVPVGSKLEIFSTATADAYALNIGGTGYTSGVVGIVGAETTPAAGATGSLFISSGTIVEAASGTHPYLSNLFIPAPTITPGSATVTDAGTIVVGGPTTATVTGSNNAILAATGDIRAGNGNLHLSTAGNKINIATGSNASVGVSGAMTAGTITISTTAVTSSSIIILTHATVGGTQGILSVGTITNGTSFVINSSNAADTGTVNWWIIN